jgi:hypothetical protein
MRRLALAVLVGMVLGAIEGCVTPSIPIPPPSPEKMSFTITVTDTISTATFSYPPDMNYEGGTAYLFNHETGMGVFQIVNPDNSIGPMSLGAAVGDQLVITLEAVDQTVSRCIVLREGTQDPNTYCSF